MRSPASNALVAIAAATASAFPGPATAQDTSNDAIRRELDAQQLRIQQLEKLLAEQTELLKQMRAVQPVAASHPVPDTATPSQAPANPAVLPVRAPSAAEATLNPPIVASATAPAFRVPGLDVSGDLRVREEFNWSDADARDRWRSVLRARVRASYAVTPSITVGTQIATGDPDDPNSTDITLSNFDDDLDASFDQAWVRYQRGGFTAFAGKFPQIFQRTDMVWDGDVVPEGIGAIYNTQFGSTRIDARAMYFVIDEAAAAKDSDMIGGQFVMATPLSSSLRLSLAGSYYHYRLGSVAGADSGDFRSNLIVDGHYRSDFHLVEGLATLNWAGPSPRWPVTVTADYVRNLGSAVSSDTGFNLEFAAGRTAERGDWRIAYNYSEVGVDAVFAAFTHDNVNIATNYKLHGLGIAYVPAKDLVLDLVFYHYRPLDAAYAGTNAPRDWLNRLRMNFLINF